MQVLIGDRVRWMSNDGWKRGEVLQIFNTQDAYGEYVNFYRISYNDGFGGTGTAMISSDQFEETQFRVTFRDVEIQIARGEKVIEDSWARNPDRSGGQYSDSEILESLNRW